MHEGHEKMSKLNFLDWFVIALMIAAVVEAIYLQTLRHP